LLPPLAFACVNERELSPASYKRSADGGLDVTKEHGEKVPFAIWDPDKKSHQTSYSKFAKPLRVTLEKGDMLYLPAIWQVFICLALLLETH
jgi:jumonji domain-containing protein 7